MLWLRNKESIQCGMIPLAKVNAPEGTDAGEIARKSCGGLRRVYTEIEKLKRI